MVTTQEALRGLIILTITDSRGVVIIHETVKAEDVDVIAARVCRTIR